MTSAFTFQQDLERLPKETQTILCQLAQAYADCRVTADQHAGLQYALQLITHVEELNQYSSAEIINYLLELDLIHPQRDLYHRLFED